MPEPRAYYEATIQVGDKAGTATFYQSSTGEFDLLYGFAAFTASTSRTLEDAVEDVRQHLEKQNPGKSVVVGQPRPITKQRAEENSPNYEP